LTIALVTAALGACASVDPRPDYDRARNEIRAATGIDELHDPQQPLLGPGELDAALADGLGLDEAARLALLNNRRLHAGFLSLGVARAEFVQAGLLENPSLSLAFLVPDGGGRVRWNADVLGNIADLWRIPARQSLARAGLEQRVLELSRFAGDLVASTRRAYVESVAAGAAQSVARDDAQLARQSLNGVRRRVQEGVASAADEALAASLALEADFALQSAERERVRSVRELAALLSLERDLIDVALTDPLPVPEPDALDREALVARSVEARADARAARAAVEAAEAALDLERRSRFGLSAGVSVERPEGGGSGDPLIGPAATVELPIFDQHQARIARAELELGQRRKESEALTAEIRQSVRAAADTAVLAARAAAYARDELVPQAVRGAALAQRAHELGDTTILAQLDAQRTLLGARRGAVAARLEAALARIELERAVGAPLGAPQERNEGR
jgi:outer membrane protein TolC